MARDPFPIPRDHHLSGVGRRTLPTAIATEDLLDECVHRFRRPMTRPDGERIAVCERCGDVEVAAEETKAANAVHGQVENGVNDGTEY
jgi:hypothetical protein